MFKVSRTPAPDTSDHRYSLGDSIRDELRAAAHLLVPPAELHNVLAQVDTLTDDAGPDDVRAVLTTIDERLRASNIFELAFQYRWNPER